MRYMSVCSGVEAASLAWRGLGWEPVAFSEIDPFPCAVLAERFPGVPNLGDMTKIEGEEDGAITNGVCRIEGGIDLLVGGTPCQDVSVAGNRAGLVEGKRSSLAFSYIRLARKTRARWLVWENVPGVLTAKNGRDFAAFVGQLAGWDVPMPADGWGNGGIIQNQRGGYGLAYRVLDAQCLTLNIREFPDFPAQSRNADGAFSSSDTVAGLTEVLWTGKIPLRYYLTEKACRGILRRAENRGKTLPDILRKALTEQAVMMESLEEAMKSQRKEDRLTAGERLEAEARRMGFADAYEMTRQELARKARLRESSRFAPTGATP